MAALPAQAQTDTVKVATDINKVVVTKRADGQLTVSLKGKPKYDAYSYSYSAYPKPADMTDSAETEPLLPKIPAKKKLKTWKALTFPGCYVGFVAGTAGNDFGMKMRRSWEIGVALFGVKYRPWQSQSHFTATVDFAVRTFSTGKSDQMLTGYAPLQFYKPSNGARIKSNSINLWQLSVPLLYHQNIHKEFELALGAQLNWNCGSYGHTTYTRDSSKMKHSDTLKGLGQRAFTVDVMATIGWRGEVQFYAKYSPMSVYSPEFGPDIRTVSFGFRFGF